MKDGRLQMTVGRRNLVLGIRNLCTSSSEVNGEAGSSGQFAIGSGQFANLCRGRGFSRKSLGFLVKNDKILPGNVIKLSTCCAYLERRFL